MPSQIPAFAVAFICLLSSAMLGCKDDKPSGQSSAAPSAALLASPEVRRSIDVPPHAVEVASGKGELSYKAEQDGAMYMSDESIKRMVMRKHLRAGQQFEFSPKTGQAQIDGQVVYLLSRGTKHEFKLYFEKE